MKMEKENPTVRSVAKVVKSLATLLMIGSIMAFSGGLLTYGVLTLIFDKTTVSVTGLPGAVAAGTAEGTADIPVARVFASYIPAFAGVVLSIFFFFQLRKTAEKTEQHEALFYKGSYKELLKLAAAALITNGTQYIIYFGLKYSLSADTLPKNFGNLLLFVSLVLFILAFAFRKKEKRQEKSGPSANGLSDQNTVCGDSSPEKEYQP